MKAVLKIFILALALNSLGAQAAVVMIESNRTDQNEILSFDLSDQGQLRALSQYATLGKGFVDSTFALGPFDSDQQLLTNASGTLLFAVNSGSNSISVFHVRPDKTLASVQGSPFYSQGINPVSLGLSGNILTVVNKHGDPAQDAEPSLPNYTTFWLNSNGSLRWIKDSTVEVANGSSPTQALVSPFGPLVFGADFLGGLMQSFQISAMGRLERRSTLALPPQVFGSSAAPRLPLGLAAHPRQAVIYAGYPTVNKIGIYSYDVNGTLHFVRAIDDSGAAVCWLVVNRAGTRLYAANTADPSVTVYNIAKNPLEPRELQKVTLSSSGGAYQLALSPDQQQLVVLTQRYLPTAPQGEGNELHVFKVTPNSGALTEAANSPLKLSLPGDTRPQGLVIH